MDTFGDCEEENRTFESPAGIAIDKTTGRFTSATSNIT